MPVVCNCPRDHLCDACLQRDHECLISVAGHRAAWAERVWKAPNLQREPGPRTPKARALAERNVSDITGDPRLLARFAD